MEITKLRLNLKFRGTALFNKQPSTETQVFYLLVQFGVNLPEIAVPFCMVVETGVYSLATEKQPSYKNKPIIVLTLP